MHSADYVECIRVPSSDQGVEVHTVKPWANPAYRTSFREGTITSVAPGPKLTVQYNDGKQPAEQSQINPKFVKALIPISRSIAKPMEKLTFSNPGGSD